MELLSNFTDDEKRLLLDRLIRSKPGPNYELSWDHVVSQDTIFVKKEIKNQTLKLMDKLLENEKAFLIQLASLEESATSFGNQGKHSQSIDIFETIKKKAPWNSIAIMSLGVQYAKAGKGFMAVQTIKEALAMDPDNGQIKQNLRAVMKDFPGA